MTNIVLGNISSFVNDSTAVTQYNANNALITTAFSDALSKSGESPNTMSAVLDMNNYNIINLPSPATINSPVRLVDVINPSVALTVPPVGTSGSTVPLLNGNNTWSGTNTFNSTVTLPAQTAITAIANATSSSASPTATPLSTITAVVNPVWYGADPTATSDSAAAINSAIAALPATGGIIKFSPGKYKINSKITVNCPSSLYSLTIEGSGQDSTILYWPTATGGILINQNSIRNSLHVRDITFSTGTTSGGTGLSVVQNVTNTGGSSPSDLFRVTFRGDDGGGVTDYWTTGCILQSVNTFNLDSCSFYGTAGAQGIGLRVLGTGSTFYSVLINVDKCFFTYLNDGFVYGDYTQGVNINLGTFNSCNTGILVSSGAVGTLAQLFVTNCEFATFGTCISVLSVLFNLQVINNNFFVPVSLTGITIATGCTVPFIISDNWFDGAALGGNFGVKVGSAAISGGVIEGNIFYSLAVGVTLDTSANSIFISNNQFLLTTVSTILDSGTNTTIINNPGYNPFGISAAANVGASPATITAGPSPETHYLNQSATNTATVTKGGQLIATLTGASNYWPIYLDPHGSYVVTWATTQPTYTKDIH
jgi:hypothetical protein